MILSSLKLENFRNYNDFFFEFAPITVFIGPNGIGKTNIIEAVYFLSVGKSFRTRKDNEVVKWGKDFLRINGKINNDNYEIFVSQAPEQTKNFKINSIQKKPIEFLGNLKIILFSPESMEIITGSPKNRRKFLDLILMQVDKTYLRNLIELQKILKNRNSILFGIKIGKNKANELLFWNNKLIELSIYIINKRKEFINLINKNISRVYSIISREDNNLSLKYISTIEDLEYFPDILYQNQEREISESSTIYGPHRDDIKFILDGKEISSFASRGEIRSVIFALKMTELEYLRSLGSVPLILLDDIFSELDEERREKLTEIIKNEQVIITSTDKDLINFKNYKPKIVELKNV